MNVDVVTGTDSKENDSFSGHSEIHYTLEQCFHDIINGKSLELDLKTLEYFLRKNLKVYYYNGLNQKLKSLLPYMLVVFIKSWPGWQKFNSYTKKEISFKDWFNKFEKYLLYKVNYIIKSEFDKAMILMKNSQPIEDSILFKIDNATQTVKENTKDISPFKIQIEGPAKLLNSILFYEAGDDVILREYRVNIPWPETLSPRQILNWPYVEVEFKTKELHFKRANIHLLQKFLTLSTDKSSIKRERKIIEEADIINEELPREAYKLDTMKKFCASYLSTLKQQQSRLKWPKLRWQEVEQLLDELLSDISHINVNNSIATNTSVVFNLTINGYARNRSCKKRDDDSPCYTEWFNPRVCLSFQEFSGINYNKEYSTFHHHELEKSQNWELLQMYIPQIEYSCSYCNKCYISIGAIWLHLKTVHVNEQPFLCLKCKKEHLVTELTKTRWAHLCS